MDSTDRPANRPDGPLWQRPLIPTALALVAGIGLGTMFSGHFMLILIAVVLSAAGIFRGVFQQKSMWMWPLIFLSGAGYLSVQPWLAGKAAANHVVHYAEQGKWRISGTVVDSPEVSNGRLQFVLAAGHMVRGQQQVDVRGRVRVTARGRFPDLMRGDGVQVEGHLHAIRSFCNPGGFDYERFMALQGVRTRLYAQGKHIRRLSQGAPGWRGRLDEIRRNLARRMDETLPGHHPAAVALLKALTLGERDAVSKDTREAFNRAGVSHVLAISGLHIGMVAATAFVLFIRLLVWVPVMTRNGWARKAAAALSLFPVIGYGLLAGLSPSTQRAMVMVAAFLLTYWVGRRHDWFNALALAAMAILIPAPPALTSVSFQLSFVAVAAIMTGMGALPFLSFTPDAPLMRRWALRTAVFVCVSIFAVMGTAPLVMRYFNQISWAGPLANLVVVPAVGMLVVPFGLAGVLLAPLTDVLCRICWHVAAFGLDGLLWLVEKVAHLTFSASITVTPTFLELTLYYALFALMFLIKHRRVRYAGMAIVMTVAVLDGAYWVQRRFYPSRMTVTAVDVGQGSANVLQLPGGAVVVVDGGGFSDNSSFDVGRSVLAPFLWRNKIKTIDLVVLTHPNSDHLNGLLFILDRFNVKQVWSNHEPADTMGYRQWKNIIEKRGIDHPSFEQLQRGTSIQGVTFEIMAPPQDFLMLQEKDRWRDTNNNSLVIRVQCRDISFLFAGDVMAPAEAEMVRLHGSQRLHSTVLVVAHHGSKSSSSAGFLQAVAPEVCVIPVGWQNRFRFPHADALRRLEKTDALIRRVDLCGAVQVHTDGTAYRIETCREQGPS